jgi:2-polyprenyl-3-methyl-5-hydroxy-6-metoxy-1,4-benzoquinol methylase
MPLDLDEEFDAHILVIDDGSTDDTAQVARDALQRIGLPYGWTVLANPHNQGYGGNQKLGYRWAIDHKFDVVVMVHGDGQYPPEHIRPLARLAQEHGAAFGSRMATPGGARRGGMPTYKYFGNRILTSVQNSLLGTNLTEFHSGFRAYRTDILDSIPFSLNSNDFHFDTEIIIQFLLAGRRIAELPIPTYYGDEICRVNARVLDLGCAGGYVGALLRRHRGCRVTGVDKVPLGPGVELDRFILHDLNDGFPAVDAADFDYILLLDVLEHLASPERFVEQLRAALNFTPNTKLLVSTANIGFVVNRLMLLVGQFNYGKRGILDLTHTRLFTFASFRRLFEQGGFRVTATSGIPGPFPLAIRNAAVARFVLRINQWLIAVLPRAFSYQIFFVVDPMPSLAYLLQQAHEQSAALSEAEKRRAAG